MGAVVGFDHGFCRRIIYERFSRDNWSVPLSHWRIAKIGVATTSLTPRLNKYWALVAVGMNFGGGTILLRLCVCALCLIIAAQPAFARLLCYIRVSFCTLKEYDKATRQTSLDTQIDKCLRWVTPVAKEIIIAWRAAIQNVQPIFISLK